jgi:hypothetical protein
MNQEKKNNIKDFIMSNFGKIISILLLVHILIGFGFLLYNRYKADDKVTYKYEVVDGNKKYKSNEVYFGNKFVLFFEGKSGTYEKNRNTVKIYSTYNVDTLGKKIIVTTNDTIPN